MKQNKLTPKEAEEINAEMEKKTLETKKGNYGVTVRIKEIKIDR